MNPFQRPVYGFPMPPIVPPGMPPLPYAMPPFVPQGMLRPTIFNAPLPQNFTPPSAINPTPPSTAASAEHEKMTTVFVGSIPPGVHDEWIERILKTCGALKQWKRVRNADNSPKTFGFATYEHPDSLLRALRLVGGEGRPSPLEIPALDGSGVVRKLMMKVDEKTKSLLESYKATKISTKSDVDADRLAENHLGEVLKAIKALIPAAKSNHGMPSESNAAPETQQNASGVTGPNSVLPTTQPQSQIQLSSTDGSQTIIASQIAQFKEKVLNQKKMEDDRMRRIREEILSHRPPPRPNRPEQPPQPQPQPQAPAQDLNTQLQSSSTPISLVPRQVRSSTEHSSDSSNKHARRDRDRGHDRESDEKDRDRDRRRRHRDRSHERSRRDRSNIIEKEDGELVEDVSKRRKRSHSRSGSRHRHRSSRHRRHRSHSKENDGDRESRHRRHRHRSSSRSDSKHRKVREVEEDHIVEAAEDETASSIITVNVSNTHDEQSMHSDLTSDLQCEVSTPDSPVMSIISTNTSAFQKLSFSLGATTAPRKRNTTDASSLLDVDDDDSDQSGRKRTKLIRLDYGSEKLPEDVAKENAIKKEIIEKIPVEKVHLFKWEVKWNLVDEDLLQNKLSPFINKKIAEYLGEPEVELTQFLLEGIKDKLNPDELVSELEMAIDEEAPILLMKVWRMLIFETEWKAVTMASGSK